MNKLKPCPFCGSKAELIGKYVFWVSCSNEKCQCNIRRYVTEYEAIEAWNWREE